MIKFDSAEEMLKTITSGIDIYSPSLGLYAFVYNEQGSICVYTDITVSDVAKMSDKEYWSSFLGPHNSIIYDSVEYMRENRITGRTTNMQWCEDMISCGIGNWKIVALRDKDIAGN